jgi:hypothetical protein
MEGRRVPVCIIQSSCTVILRICNELVFVREQPSIQEHAGFYCHVFFSFLRNEALRWTSNDYTQHYC